LAVEQTVVALATVACTSWAVRLIRAGARRADADAGALSRRMAAQDAALAAEEIKSRAATTVHDDVLSVLRAISVAGRPLPWSLVVAKAKGAQDALARQGSGGTKGPADLGSALRRAGESAAELDVRYDIDGDIDVPRSAVEALSAAAGEALRNVAAHAGVSSALVTARGRPVRRGHSSRLRRRDGLRSGPGRTGEHRPAQQRPEAPCRRRRPGGDHLSAGAGHISGANVESFPSASASAPDPLAWARRMTPSPPLIFAGFMLPLLLSGLVLLCLHWQDMR
jgi:hypothetical protein